MTIEHCLAEGRYQFERIQRDHHGHADAWVAAIHFFVAGENHFPEGLKVLQYAIDRKMPGNMNSIVPAPPQTAIQVRDLIREHASIIPAILVEFKKIMDSQKIPIADTEIHRQILTGYFQIQILEQMLLNWDAEDKKKEETAKLSTDKKKIEKKQLREVRRAATIITNYFLGHAIILAKALELCQKEGITLTSDNKRFRKDSL
jgi:hypothetical protein